jgi:hypothetical protein
MRAISSRSVSMTFTRLYGWARRNGWNQRQARSNSRFHPNDCLGPYNGEKGLFGDGGLDWEARPYGQTTATIETT